MACFPISLVTVFDNRVQISDRENWVYYPFLVLNLKLPVENTVVM